MAKPITLSHRVRSGGWESMISANGGLPAHRYTPQVTPRWPRGSEPASPRSNPLGCCAALSHPSSRVYTPPGRQQPCGAGPLDPHPSGDRFVCLARIAPLPPPPLTPVPSPIAHRLGRAPLRPGCSYPGRLFVVFPPLPRTLQSVAPGSPPKDPVRGLGPSSTPPRMLQSGASF